jgi:hypothetical protein
MTTPSLSPRHEALLRRVLAAGEPVAPSALELALQVSRPTINRDLRDLLAAGFLEKRGGWSLDPLPGHRSGRGSAARFARWRPGAGRVWRPSMVGGCTAPGRVAACTLGHPHLRGLRQRVREQLHPEPVQPAAAAIGHRLVRRRPQPGPATCRNLRARSAGAVAHRPVLVVIAPRGQQQELAGHQGTLRARPTRRPTRRRHADAAQSQERHRVHGRCGADGVASPCPSSSTCRPS